MNTETTISGVDASDESMVDPIEARVLAVLAEKEALTPDSYPLSLNALANGCNQLSSRDPVMTLTEDAVLDALQRLIQKKLVAEVSQAGARVTKYEHRMRIKWSLEQNRLAILTVLMLRGIQTAGEIRTRSGRMHEFASLAEVEAGLQFLIDKYPPLVARLARAPGAKEPRYAHLLSGRQALAQAEEAAAGFSTGVSVGGVSRIDRLEQLEHEVMDLRQQVELLTQQFDSFKKQFE